MHQGMTSGRMPRSTCAILSYMARRTIIVLMVLVLASGVASAQEPESLEQMISSLYDGSVRVVGLAAFLMFLYAGVLRMLPEGLGGNPQRSNEIMIDAVVGMVLLLSAVLILDSINPDLTNQPQLIQNQLIQYLDVPER